MGNFQTHVDSQQVFFLGFCPCRSGAWISGNDSAYHWNHAGVWRRTLKCWHLIFAAKTKSWWVRSEASFVISCLMADQNTINFQNYSFHLNAFPKLKLSKALCIFPFNTLYYWHFNLFRSSSAAEKCAYAWTVYWKRRLQHPFSVCPWNLICYVETATLNQTSVLLLAVVRTWCFRGKQNPLYALSQSYYLV